jgi:hypothetical protein
MRLQKALEKYGPALEKAIQKYRDAKEIRARAAARKEVQDSARRP